MRRTPIAAVLGLFAALLAPGTLPAQAAGDVTYSADFEANGSTIVAGQEVTNQYPFVTFDTANIAGSGWSYGTPGTGVLAQVDYENPVVYSGSAHGGQYSGDVQCPAEFCAHGTYGVLNDTADGISVYAGSAAGNLPLELDAYDSAKHLLGSEQKTPATTGAQTLLSLSAPSGKSIAYFTVYQSGAGGGIGGGNDLYIDDLTIHVPSGAAPAVGVSAPTSTYELGQDGTITIPLTVHRINGASGAVTIHVSGFGSGVTGSVSNPGTGNTATLTVSASHTAATASGVPLGLSASATDTESEPPVTVTIQVTAPILAFSGPTELSPQTCSSRQFTVEAQVAPGEPGGQVDFSTTISPATTGLSASATTPAPITSGLADTTVKLRSTGGGSATLLFVQATLGNGDSQTDQITVLRDPPTITAADSLGSQVAHTPHAGGHGNTLEIYAHGLCDTATVAVGNQRATVGATVQHLSGNQGAYDYLRVETPRLATAGHVTITTGSPPVTSDPSTAKLNVDSYRNTDGWNFHNFDANLTWDDLVQAFGDSQTYFQIDPCAAATLGIGHCPIDAIPDPSALAWLWIAQASLEGGTCFGMSLATQRLLEGRDSLGSLPGNPADVYSAPAPDTGWSAQAVHGTQPVLDLVKATHLMQFSTEFLGQFLGTQLGASLGFTDSDSVANAIDNVLAKGRYPLIQLVDGTGHILVAYDISQTGPGAFDIYVYDVNDPFTSDEDHPQITGGHLLDGTTHQTRMTASVIHLAADGSWSLASTTDGAGNSFHGGLANINVFDPNAVPVHPTLGSASGGVNGLTGLLANSSAPLGSRATTAASAAITQIAAGGKTLYASDGSPNTDASTRLDAALYAPIVGASSTGRPALVAVGGHVHDLTVSTTAGSTGRNSLTFVQGGYVGGVDASTSSGAKQQATFASDHDAAGFTGNSTQPVTLDVTHHTSGGARTVGVTFRTAGTGDRLAVGPGGGVTISHTGGPTAFGLVLSAASSTGAPATFRTGPVTIHGKTLKLAGIRWGSLDLSRLRLRIGGRSVVLPNHATTARKATISRLAVTRISRHRLAVTLVAKLPKLPTGSRAALVWLVRRGHHLLARHVVDVPVNPRRIHDRWLTRSKAKQLTVTAAVVAIAITGTTESATTTTRSRSVHPGHRQ